MKKTKLLINAVLVAFLLLFTVSCSDDEPINGGGDDPVEEPKGAIDIINKIEVITHYGHLHGSSFHGNAQPEKSPFLRRQVLVLERNEDNTWKQVSFSGKENLNEDALFIMEGTISDKQLTDNEGGRYAFEFIYYNKKGKRINSEFFNESDKYQTFFSIASYKDNETKEETKLDNLGEEILAYSRDTDPEDKMYKKGGVAKLAKNYLGLKGYMALKKSRISFDLTINFVKFKEGYTKSQKAIFNGVNEADIEEKITFNLPINIITEHPEDDAAYDARLKELSDFYGITPEELDDLEWGDIDPESSKYWM